MSASWSGRGTNPVKAARSHGADARATMLASLGCMSTLIAFVTRSPYRPYVRDKGRGTGRPGRRAAEHELADRRLAFKAESGQACEKLGVAAAKRTRCEPHSRRDQVHGLIERAHILQHGCIGNRLVFPGDPAESRRDHDQHLGYELLCRRRSWRGQGDARSRRRPFSPTPAGDAARRSDTGRDRDPGTGRSPGRAPARTVRLRMGRACSRSRTIRPGRRPAREPPAARLPAAAPPGRGTPRAHRRRSGPPVLAHRAPRLHDGRKRGILRGRCPAGCGSELNTLPVLRRRIQGQGRPGPQEPERRPDGVVVPPIRLRAWNNRSWNSQLASGWSRSSPPHGNRR